MIRPLLKPYNTLAAGYSYVRSSVTGKGDVLGMPLTISTEISSFCNLKCPECNSGSGMMTRKRGYMNLDLFDKIISELRPWLLGINLYFQGEPMMHPQFFSFIEKSAGINSVVSTNGHFLSDENAIRIVDSGLGKLIVSLDGMDKDSYEMYRINGNYDQVIRGIKNVSDAMKKRPSGMKLEIQFLVNRHNEDQVPQVKRLAREMNAGLKLKSMQVIRDGHHKEWLPRNKRFSRYKLKEDSYVIKSSLNDRCSRLWFNPVVTWDGKVVPCCFDKDADHVMGDINEDSFRDIWQGPKYRIFRKSVFSGRHTIGICCNCTAGLKGVSY